jgi:putative serine/threonine protein kinase
LESKLTPERWTEEPYASVLCYPRPSNTELRKRLKELRRLGIATLEFVGEKKVGNVSVLGKGCVGIVMIAYRNNERVALKIRRVDADRSSMRREARLLERANSVLVGPKLLGVSKNFLVSRFISGELLPEWLKKRRSETLTKAVLCGVLEQCLRLDFAGLDHGELSNAPKHVIVNRENKPCIVDFETASLHRRPSNVTSICQFLFVGGAVARTVAGELGEVDKDRVIEALRRYKNERNRRNFERILDVCGVQTT